MATELALTEEERAMLAGAEGPGVRRALEMVVALARIYGARRLVPIASAQVSGVSYANIGEAGLEFLEQWARDGARARVSAYLNPAGMDLESWAEMGLPEGFARQQLAVVEAYRRLGVQLSLTCAPYFSAPPSLGQHLAWAESSAVCYANSLLGARTNREGGPGALAAAIVGRTGCYGLHLEENRLPTELYLVRAQLKTGADWGALGAIVGRAARGVPWLAFGPGALPARLEQVQEGLRLFGAAAAALGSVALFHAEGLTAEASAGLVKAPAAAPKPIESLDEAYSLLDGQTERLDLVALGCPHASLGQLRAVAEFMAGRRARVRTWVATSRQVAEEAQRLGLAGKLQEAGIRLVRDTCVVVSPLELLGIRAVATDSAKAAFYLRSQQGVQVRFGSTERCLEASIRGRWQ
jgi:predicted aconitase